LGWPPRLQSRGVAYDDEDKLGPMPIDLNINVASSVGFQYCPWCGKPVQKKIESNREFFTELARKPEKLRTLLF
jgi:hypothetical protein